MCKSLAGEGLNRLMPKCCCLLVKGSKVHSRDQNKAALNIPEMPFDSLKIVKA